MYPELREACLSKENQEFLPDWPYPLLFHGEELTKDIFFLDVMLEGAALDLGRNPVRDGDFFRYRHLNQWFHYRFFWNRFPAPVVNSAETITLLPRLFRLRRVLLESSSAETVNSFLERKLSVANPRDLIGTLIGALTRIAEICSKNELVVWGFLCNSRALDEHLGYLQTVSLIRTDLVLALPHLSRLKNDWGDALEVEQKEFRKVEARYNKSKKAQARGGDRASHE